MAIKEIFVPDLGGAESVDVIELNVKPGDQVQVDEGIVTLESDKATLEVPATFAGVIKEFFIKVGDKISEGDKVASVETVGAGLVPAHDENLGATGAHPLESATSSQIIDVIVPDLGGADKVDVIEINVKPGDNVEIDAGLITLESDKATMEVPAPFAGVIESITVKVGDKVSEGNKVASIKIVGASGAGPFEPATPTKNNLANVGATGGRPPESATSTKNAQDNNALQQLRQTAEASAINSSLHATPIVRRIASEFGVDLTRVKATGPKGRILKEDVQTYVKQQLVIAQSGGKSGFTLPEMPAVDFSKFGAIETQALSKIKRLTGTNLGRNWIVVPHVTQFDEADITELEAFRKENKSESEAKGIKLTPLAFIMKAVVSALKQFPRFNASLSADVQSLILKKYFNIGVAVDTPDGLVVPVVRDVDRKGVYELAQELAVISEKARQQKLLPKDMQGGCFTISSLGGIGGTWFTPIVNAPEVAILGVSKAQMKPVYQEGDFVPRLVMPVSLSYDHRVVDGAEGARFTSYLCKELADIRKLVL
ncbi:MAG: dihydrolipoyllysine-residue acetyltransferase [Gammaproteobacteria bacterium]|nr:dihydrolipoyllysine-residue acetyltransferase [Gammaproteobacteria bacterium]